MKVSEGVLVAISRSFLRGDAKSVLAERGRGGDGKKFARGCD